MLTLRYFTEGAGLARHEKFDVMSGHFLAAIARRGELPAVATILDYNGSISPTLFPQVVEVSLFIRGAGRLHLVSNQREEGRTSDRIHGLTHYNFAIYSPRLSLLPR